MADGATTKRNRAIILCLFQSGVRAGCLCRWTYGMIAEDLYDEPRIPVRLKITQAQDTKLSGYGLPYYYTFLAREAAEALREYIDQRRGRGWDPRPGDPIFVTEASTTQGAPITPWSVLMAVKTAAKRVRLDPDRIWSHCLRKAFRKVLNGSHMGEDTKEAIMGHKLPGSRGSYFDYHDVDEIADKYAQVNWSLRVGNRVTILEQEIADLRGRLETLRKGTFAKALKGIEHGKQLDAELGHMKAGAKRAMDELEHMKAEAKRAIDEVTRLTAGLEQRLLGELVRRLSSSTDREIKGLLKRIAKAYEEYRCEIGRSAGSD